MATAASSAVLVTQIPAQASTTSPSSAATTCYGGASSWSRSTYANGTIRLPSSGYYTTTSRCGDINFKIDSSGDLGTVDVDVCFQSTGCNSMKYISDYNWHLIATDVKDGTTFYVNIHNTQDWSFAATGRLAY